MRFFKYLILLFLSSFSFSVLASDTYRVQNISGTFLSPEAACRYYSQASQYRAFSSPSGDAIGYCYEIGNSGAPTVYVVHPSCPSSGSTKWIDGFITPPDGQAPSSICYQGCKYISSSVSVAFSTPNGNLSWGTDYTSQGQTCPVDTPKGDDICNTSNPYGGCYIPPNDNCTRLSNGSITCPNNGTPPINNTCNGATYCVRPPEGCGSGYVSGSFNGQALCVKSGSGPGTGGDGTGPGSNTSTSTSTSSSSSNSSSSSSNSGTGGGDTIVNNTNNNTNNVTNNTTVNIDVSSIVNAINTLKNSLNPILTDVNNSVKSVNSTLIGTNQKLDTANTSLNTINQNTQSTNNKLDSTNTKLDSANTSLNAINQNGQTTNAKLQELINKPTGEGTGFSDTGIINAIKDQTTEIKDFFTPDQSLKTQIESIGNESNDGRYLGSQNNASSSLQSLANAMTFSNAACVPDLELDVPIYGSVIIPLSKWCDILAIVKIFIQLAALILAFRMINESVRSF